MVVLESVLRIQAVPKKNWPSRSVEHAVCQVFDTASDRPRVGVRVVSIGSGSGIELG